MSQPDIISIVESSMHPNYSDLYASKGLSEVKVNSVRKAIQLARRVKPRFIVAEFFYAYSTNYSGVHKSNLDVLLVSLHKYSPLTRVIALCDKEDARHIDVLENLEHPLAGWLVHPTSEADMAALLDA
jgi:hypothetical protein